MSTQAQELQARWSAVVRHFRAWSMVFDMFFDPRSYKLWGADLVSGVLINRRSRAAAAQLEGASAETLNALSEMARINTQRSGDVFKAVAICYITLPLGVAALASDAAPAEVRAAINAYWSYLVYLLFALALSAIAYHFSHWRTKQIAWTIDLYRTGALRSAPGKARS